MRISGALLLGTGQLLQAGSGAEGRDAGGVPPHLLAKLAEFLVFYGWNVQMGSLAIRHGAMQSL